MVVVLGLDPGSRVTGYGIVAETSGCLSLVEAGTIRPPAKRDLPYRLGKIYSGLAEIISRHAPQESALENVFVYKNVQSALKLGQARGAALAACTVAGLPVAEYEPTKVKKSIVGVGNAPKDQVAFMVARLLGVANPDWAEDASDALAVAICHLNQRRLNHLAGL
ncbi:Holliday junction endonuclease RuvC [Paucidesulfovibrio gracilis DSM 16080]|uniref:Crossover junction endodeoxyribonuclease RuvC n=1 Tax=Paucidesulfovibrio gracilis DSM 16080 TaxID=1121449 RepID=A0A1T4WAV6_9BACT|nr:crossover junction endodeoxyribonuclease RuvC [Paucidesulfovibrio gracilis]SKA74085.1 Holliday junction endonuclease RuvC [Paucidesulfovibrio gracilis DSM 16080]